MSCRRRPALGRQGRRVEWGEATADPGDADRGIQPAHGFGDLLAALVVAVGLTPGVGGEQVRAGSQLLPLLGGGLRAFLSSES